MSSSRASRRKPLQIANASLKDYAYYATGGTCDVLYAPTSVEDLARAVREIKASGRPFFYLGGGTNSLVLDEHFPGAVIVFRELNELRFDGNKATVGAGVDNTFFAKKARERGLAGAAWMNRLPGQMGGTVRMNARCYGGEISQIVTRVTVVTLDGAIKDYRDQSVFRGYKDTLFMETGDAIASCEIALVPGDPAAIEATMKFCEDDRTAKGQFDHPSCGCVFKNDYSVGVSSGILLDQAGAKTVKVGGAAVSPQHANFVYNKGATSRDILEASFQMRERVFEKFGAWMEYEMEVLGRLPDDLQRRVFERRAPRLNEALLAPLRARMAKS